MISCFGSSIGNNELEAVGRVFEAQWIGQGREVEKFERMIAAKAAAPDFAFLNNGSNALQMAIHLCNLPKRTEVILPSFTWWACANAILLNDLIPVLADVSYDTGNITEEAIERQINPKTSAILVVHYAGKPANMDEIKSFRLPVIEDAAHAIDSSYKGKHCGMLGEVGIFSFDAVKNLTTGEGGGVVSNDLEMIHRAKKLRYAGISKSGFENSQNRSHWWQYEINESYPKMTNTDIAAAIGLQQLEKLPDLQRRRKEIWEIYMKVLSEDWACSWITCPSSPEKHERHSYFTYCVKISNGKRDELANFLFQNEVYTVLSYHPLHLYDYLKTDYRLVNCERLAESALNLPIHPRLSNNDLDKIISLLKEFALQRG